MRDTQAAPGTQSGREPAEGRDDLGLPGADRAGPPSENPEGPIGTAQPARDVFEDPGAPASTEPDRTADDVGVGMPPPSGAAEPDVLPDVQLPDTETHD